MDLDKNILKIVYITDENYVQPVLTGIVSLLKNNRTKCKVYIITTFENEITFAQFRSLESKSAEIIIKPVNLNDYIPEGVKTNSHVSQSALIKFFLPEILNDEDKVLYVDCDTIVQKSLDELYCTDIGENYAGVVFDAALVVMPQHARCLQIPPDRYFNTGVMLLNLAQMRKDNLSGKLLSYKINGENFFMDQDAFNKIMSGCVKFLPFKYNTSLLSFNIPQAVVNYFPDIPFSRNERIKAAVVLHFADKFKPWLYNRGVLTKIYKKYYCLTPYKKQKLRIKNYENVFVFRFVKSVLRENFI